MTAITDTQTAATFDEAAEMTGFTLDDLYALLAENQDLVGDDKTGVTTTGLAVLLAQAGVPVTARIIPAVDGDEFDTVSIEVRGEQVDAFMVPSSEDDDLPLAAELARRGYADTTIVGA